MGMVISAANFGAAAGSFLLGNNQPADHAPALAGNFQLGTAFQAQAPGTANNIVIVGDANDNPTLSFRLCVYAASSDTVWSGALLGQTADQTGLGINEVKSVPLLAPISWAAGDWLALCIQCSSSAGGGTAGNGAVVNGTAVSDRYVGDTFSDGPASTTGASNLNSPYGRIIYLTA